MRDAPLAAAFDRSSEFAYRPSGKYVLLNGSSHAVQDWFGWTNGATHTLLARSTPPLTRASG